MNEREFTADEVEFVEVRDGKVHVTASPPTGPRPSASFVPIIEWWMNPMWTRCGRWVYEREYLGDALQSAWTTDRFDDVRLCKACIKSVPEDQRHRLFEHPQSDDPEDDLSTAQGRWHE